MSKETRFTGTDTYVASDDLMASVEVATKLQKPLLIKGEPGTGKTMIAKSFAKSIDAEFARIQFTPDLLPSDITGINYYNQKQGEFVFRKGPVFSNILLADEINRATPRTQSALLECMEEHQVTVDGETRKLGFPFIVIATQNPIETAGTYQLPEAQLDRFLLQISMGYPKQNEELEIIKRFMTDSPLESLSAVCNADDVKGMVKEAEAHAAEDKAKKEEIEVKNNADSLVYQAEKAVKDFEGKADAATLEQVTKAKDALKAAIESGNVEDIKAKSEELTKPLYELSTKMYEQAQAAQQTAGDAQGAQGAQGGAQQNDDVVDAEYTEVKDDKKD